MADLNTDLATIYRLSKRVLESYATSLCCSRMYVEQ